MEGLNQVRHIMQMFRWFPAHLSVTITSEPDSDEKKKRLTLYYHLLESLLAVLTPTTNLVGQPITSMLEESAPLTRWHLLLQLALGTGGHPMEREQGGRTYLHKNLLPLAHSRCHCPWPLVKCVLD